MTSRGLEKYAALDKPIAMPDTKNINSRSDNLNIYKVYSATVV